MKIVCAWCGGEIGEKDGKGVDGTSHTMCQRCFDELALRAEVNGFGSGGDRATAKESEYGKKEGCDGEGRGRQGATGC